MYPTKRMQGEEPTIYSEIGPTKMPASNQKKKKKDGPYEGLLQNNWPETQEKTEKLSQTERHMTMKCNM